MSHFSYACKTEGENGISRLISALCINCLSTIREYSRIIDHSIIWMCIWCGLLQKLHKIKKSEHLNSKVSFNPFPAVYKFILVFPSDANKYICFIFFIRSPPATNIFVETINAPTHMCITVTTIFNTGNIFNNLKYIVYYGYFQCLQAF